MFAGINLLASDKELQKALLDCLQHVLRHVCLHKRKARIKDFAGKALLKEAIAFLDNATLAVPALNWSTAWQQVTTHSEKSKRCCA